MTGCVGTMKSQCLHTHTPHAVICFYLHSGGFWGQCWYMFHQSIDGASGSFPHAMTFNSSCTVSIESGEWLSQPREELFFDVSPLQWDSMGFKRSLWSYEIHQKWWCRTHLSTGCMSFCPFSSIFQWCNLPEVTNTFETAVENTQQKNTKKSKLGFVHVCLLDHFVFFFAQMSHTHHVSVFFWGPSAITDNHSTSLVWRLLRETAPVGTKNKKVGKSLKLYFINIYHVCPI